MKSPALQGVSPSGLSPKMRDFQKQMELLTVQQVVDSVPNMSDDVALWFAGNTRAAEEVLRALSEHDLHDILAALSDNSSSPPDVLDEMAEYPQFRANVVRNFSTSDETLLAMIDRGDIDQHEVMGAMVTRLGRGSSVTGASVAAALMGTTHLSENTASAIIAVWKNSPQVVDATLDSSNMSAQVANRIAESSKLSEHQIDSLLDYMEEQPSSASGSMIFASSITRAIQSDGARERHVARAIEMTTGDTRRRLVDTAACLSSDTFSDVEVARLRPDLSIPIVAMGVKRRIAARTGISSDNDEALDRLLETKWWKLSPDSQDVFIAKTMFPDREL